MQFGFKTTRWQISVVSNFSLSCEAGIFCRGLSSSRDNYQQTSASRHLKLQGQRSLSQMIGHALLQCWGSQRTNALEKVWAVSTARSRDPARLLPAPPHLIHFTSHFSKEIWREIRHESTDHIWCYVPVEAGKCTAPQSGTEWIEYVHSPRSQRNQLP
jgi:hypothetical protein